jgi:hypothetical protein
VSKASQPDVRRLLIIGAMACVSWAGRKPPAQGTWLSRMLVKKPRMLVSIALANKMARTIWAMLTKREMAHVESSWRFADMALLIAVTCRVEDQTGDLTGMRYQR